MLTLTVLAERLTVCRLGPQAALPGWALRRPFSCATRTGEELSIVCREEEAPVDVRREDGWRAFKIEGPFAFTATGVLASVTGPLAGAGIGLLAIATYDTDYILVKEVQLEQACCTLITAGHCVNMTHGG
jgi:uncharacterized protein